MLHFIRKFLAVTSSLALLGFSVVHAWSGRSAFLPPPSRSAAAYYLDCSASKNGSGTQASPWNSLASVNAFTFLPGDHLLLKRGTTCNGALTPQGSGAANFPIVIDAYGTGASAGDLRR